jgi:putative copper export protein
LPRYSRLALVCVMVLALSGVLTSALRLDSISELLTSRYGAIVSFKVVLLAGLVVAGWLQRRYVFGGTPVLRRHFVVVAALELTTMTMAFALAVALARTPPPV